MANFQEYIEKSAKKLLWGLGAKLKLKLGKHAYTYKLYIACVFYSVLMYHGVQPRMVLVVRFFKFFKINSLCCFYM